MPLNLHMADPPSQPRSVPVVARMVMGVVTFVLALGFIAAADALSSGGGRFFKGHVFW